MSGVQVNGRTVFNNSDINTPDIDGGSADGLVIGGTTPAAGDFTNVDLTGQLQGAVLNNLNSFAFGERVLSMMTDPRLLNVMCEDPSVGGASYIDISGKGHDGTPTGTWASADRVKQGRGWKYDMVGNTDRYINLGDHDDFSFGDGSNDSPFTAFGLIDVVDSGTQRIFSKLDLTSGSELREWIVSLTSAEKLYLLIYDQSATAYESKTMDTALAVGRYMYVITYDGRGGSFAASGITIYINGLAVNSTRGFVGTYVSMENLSVPLWIGASLDISGSVAELLSGGTGMEGIDAVEWSASDVWQLWQEVLAQYSENGVDLS